MTTSSLDIEVDQLICDIKKLGLGEKKRNPHEAGKLIDSKGIRTDLKELLKDYCELLTDKLGAVHPSIIFYDLFNTQFTTVTDTVLIHSKIGQTNTNDINNFPTINLVGSGLITEMITDQSGGHDSSSILQDSNLINDFSSFLNFVLDVIYLPVRDESSIGNDAHKPEFFEELSITDTQTEEIFFRSAHDISVDILEHLKSKYDNNVCIFLNAFAENLQLATLKPEFIFLKESAYYDLTFTLIRDLVSTFDSNNVQGLHIGENQSSLSSNLTHFPKDQYLFLYLLANHNNWDGDGKLHLKNTFDHSIFVTKVDYSNRSLAEGFHISGSIIATINLSKNRFVNMNNYRSILKQQLKIYRTIYDIFYDRVILDRVVRQQERSYSISLMNSVSGHSMRNRLFLLDNQIKSIILDNEDKFSKQDQDKGDMILNMSSGLHDFYNGLDLMSKLYLDKKEHLPSLFKGNEHNSQLLLEGLLHELITERYPPNAHFASNQPTMIFPIDDESEEALTKLIVDPIHFHAYFGVIDKMIIKVIFFEIFLNAAKHGINPEWKFENNLFRLEPYNTRIKVPILMKTTEIKDNDFHLELSVLNYFKKDSKCNPRFSKILPVSLENNSLSLLSSFLETVDLGRINQYKIYRGDRQPFFAVNLRLRGLGIKNEN